MQPNAKCKHCGFAFYNHQENPEYKRSYQEDCPNNPRRSIVPSKYELELVLFGSITLAVAIGWLAAYLMFRK